MGPGAVFGAPCASTVKMGDGSKKRGGCDGHGLEPIWRESISTTEKTSSLFHLFFVVCLFVCLFVCFGGCYICLFVSLYLFVCFIG